MELKNKTVLITGGNSGLGFEVAKQLVAKGAKVTILGKDKAKVNKAKKEIDVLVNNASIIAYKYADEHDPQNIRDMVDANFLGTVFVTRELFPLFRKQNSGTIINVSSTSGLPTGGHTQQSV